MFAVLSIRRDLQALEDPMVYQVHPVPQDHKAVVAHLVFEANR